MNVAEDNNQLIDWAHTQLLQAYSPPRETSQSLSGMFDGRKPSKDDKTFVQRKACKKAWHLRHTATEDSKAQFSKPPIQDRDAMTGKVKRAVAELDEVYQHYVWYRYKTKLEFEYSKLIARHIQKEMAGLMDGRRHETKRLIVAMINHVVLTSRSPKYLNHREPWTLFNIKQKNWYASFKKYWDAVNQKHNELRRNCLLTVGGKL